MNFLLKIQKQPGNRNCWLALAFAALLIWGWRVEAQQTRRTDIKVRKINTYYYDDKGVLKAIFASQSVQPLSGPNLLAQQFRMRTIKDGDEKKTEMVIEAPECIYNTDSHVASSPGALSVYNAETNFLIQGVGFLSVLNTNNAQLTISNQVQTFLRVGTNSLNASSNSLHISSDRFFFFSEIGITNGRRTATYRQNVTVEDTNYILHCNLLKAELPESGNELKSLAAEGDVVLVNKQDQSKAYGKRAFYQNKNGRELIYLEGDPRWEEPTRTASGDLFIFDKTSGTVQIMTNSSVLLKNIPIPALGNLGGTSDQTNVSNIGIKSDDLFIQVPTTNKAAPGRMEATGNVRILSEDNSISGSSPKVRYFPETGLLQMEQRGKLRVGGTEIHGNLVEVNISNKLVRSSGSSFLRLPGEAFAKSFLQEPAGTSSVSFVVVHSDSFDYSPENAVFRTNVSASYQVDTNLAAVLDAGFLRLDFDSDEQLSTLMSSNKVRLQQFPSLTGVTNPYSRDFQSDFLQLQFAPGGRSIRSFSAGGDVRFKQLNVLSTNQMVQSLEAARISGEFNPVTNVLDQATLEGQVRFSQNSDIVTGQRAVYSGGASNQPLLQVTGNPKALVRRMDRGRTNIIQVLDSEIFIWNPKTGTFKARGPWRVVPQNPPAATVPGTMR